MSRDVHLPEPEPDAEPPAGRRLQPMHPAPLVVAGCLGLLGGWGLRRVGLWTSTPEVSWVQVGVLWFLGAALSVTAWGTRRDLRAVPRRLKAQQAVNRLVMARACALVGALLAGGYAGYAIGWIDTGAAELAAGRFLRSGLAAAAGGVILVASLALERACRTGTDDEAV